MKNTHIFMLVIAIIVFIFISCNHKLSFVMQLAQDIPGYVPIDGFIPDEKTALKIAQAVWLPVYGKKISNQKPYSVKLIDGKIWLVEGTLRGILRLGGTAYIEIDKQTGTILKMTHSK